MEGNNGHYLRLLDALFEQPFVTRADVMELLSVSNPTAGSMIATFCDMGILLDISPERSRNKLYTFIDYIRILNEGTELKQ